MPGDPGYDALERIARDETARVLAALVAGCGDLDLAEESLQDAIAAALERWPGEGVPERPAAWLTTVARRRAIDRLRHRAMRAEKRGALLERELAWRAERALADSPEPETLPDERLGLVFACCHPALALEARVALALRVLGGLTTEAVARAFLVSEVTMAKRIERAKHKIRAAGIPFRVPSRSELPERMHAVLAVIYLIFNEGHGAQHPERAALAGEAIRLGAMLAGLAADAGEVHALLALMRLHHARRDARVAEDGALIPLDEQDRRRWQRAEVESALESLLRAAACGERGPYLVQAAIAAAHATSSGGASTPWPEIAALYAELESLMPSPVVRINRAVAEGRARSAQTGLALLETLARERGADRLAHYQPFHAARADLLRRAGRAQEALESYRAALELCREEPERRWLGRRLAELAANEPDAAGG